MRQYLVLDIGGTFIKYALMGEDGSFLESGKLPSPMDSLDSLLAAVASVGEKFRGRDEKAAVSMPGRIDTRTGMAHTGGAFPLIPETPAGAPVCGGAGRPGAGGHARETGPPARTPARPPPAVPLAL